MCRHLLDGHYCGKTLMETGGPEGIPLGPTTCPGGEELSSKCLWYSATGRRRKNWKFVDPLDPKPMVGKLLYRVAITPDGVVGTLSNTLFVCMDFENRVAVLNPQPLREANIDTLTGVVANAWRKGGVTYIQCEGRIWRSCTHEELKTLRPAKRVAGADKHELVGKAIQSVRLYKQGIFAYVESRCFVCTDFANAVHESSCPQPLHRAKLSMLHGAEVTQAVTTPAATFIVAAEHRWMECPKVHMRTRKELDVAPNAQPDVFNDPAALLLSSSMARVNECRSCQEKEENHCCGGCEVYTIREKAWALSQLIEPDPCEFCMEHDRCAQQLRKGYGFYPEGALPELISVHPRIEDAWDAEDIEAGSAQEYAYFEEVKA